MEENGRLYQRNGSDNWYIDWRNPVTGERVRISAKTKNKKAAQRKLDDLNAQALARTSEGTFSQMLALYEDWTTNPRRECAESEGGSYGERYAKRVAMTSRWFRKTLAEKYPLFLDKKVTEIKRIDCNRIREIILKTKGKRRAGQEAFRTFKAYFSQAIRDCLIENNPCQGLPDIRYKEVQRFAIHEDCIKALVNSRLLFFNTESWAYFTVLATTGMRKSEVLALNIDQIQGNDLKIYRALKSERVDDIGLPKCNIVRNIRLSKIALEALGSVKPDRNGRLFPHNSYWSDKQVAQWRVIGKLAYNTEDWEKITCHILRHSLNTALVANGADRFMVAEYFGWKHQDALAMQRRYTHLYTGSMQAIADKIDELVGLNSDKHLTFVNQKVYTFFARVVRLLIC